MIFLNPQNQQFFSLFNFKNKQYASTIYYIQYYRSITLDELFFKAEFKINFNSER